MKEIQEVKNYRISRTDLERSPTQQANLIKNLIRHVIRDSKGLNAPFVAEDVTETHFSFTLNDVVEK